jgi:hypothetical protein
MSTKPLSQRGHARSSRRRTDRNAPMMPERPASETDGLAAYRQGFFSAAAATISRAATSKVRYLVFRTRS